MDHEQQFRMAILPRPTRSSTWAEAAGMVALVIVLSGFAALAGSDSPADSTDESTVSETKTLMCELKR